MPGRSLDYSQIVWIGGSPCSGKSSIAQALCERHHLTLVHTDDYLFAHMAQADPASQPVMHRQSQSSWNEMFMRPVEQQIQDEFDYYREEFPMLLDELERHSAGSSLLVEGAALLPELMKQLDTSPAKIVYIIPTKEFQLEHYRNRPWIQEILDQCDQPEIAFGNWMERDARFGDAIARMAEEASMAVVRVDGKTSLEEAIVQVDRLICW